MKPVYLHRAVTADLENDAPLKTLSLWRRMTPLQKAALTVFQKAYSEAPELFQSLKNQGAPLYFTSAYGEVGAMLRLTESIEQNSLPVSPKDFQHSVLNAALAYISMQNQSHQAGMALSGGYASVDLALHLAARRIASGFDEGGIVIHAHEWAGEGEKARAEILVLSPVAGPCELLCYEQSHGITQYPCDFDEGSANAEIPWLLDGSWPKTSRTVRTLYGTLLKTEWRISG